MAHHSMQPVFPTLQVRSVPQALLSSCYPCSVTHIRRLASRSPRCCRASAARRARSSVQHAEVQA